MIADFKNMDELIRYLDQTVCMYQGEPVLVRVSQNSLEEIKITFLQTKVSKTVSYKEDAFQTYPYELGMMNYKNNVLFLSRNGNRRSNYGLALSTIHANFDGPYPFNNSSQLVTNEGFYDCIQNQYPSLSSAIKDVQKNCEAVAFHKYYFVGRVEDDENVIGIFFMEEEQPFAFFDRDKSSFFVQVKTRKNLATYSVACKSQIIPNSMQGV